MIKENVTIVDGQMYRPGDKIWDLGSFVATSARGRKRNYEGLSQDVEKLPHYVDTGSSAFCFDTGDIYKYLRSTDTWYKIGNNQASCGGCGGSGVSNYNDLNGKPKINGVTLQGDMTLEDLGIAKIMNETAGTPVGEIISYMGNTVPTNYLVCDGMEYNISEYQELANHFTKEFGQVNYFGGDGETTFAVPDLRGEFLRGTGTNSHVNSKTSLAEGSGENVGKHQSATVTSPIGVSYENNTQYISVAKESQNWSGFSYADSSSGVTYNNSYIATSGTNTNKRTGFVTSRPTNTSVLYCIKCKSDIYANDEIIKYKDISSDISVTNSNVQLNYAYIENNIINISVEGILSTGRNTFANILNEDYMPRNEIFGVWYPSIDENDISKVTYLQLDDKGNLYAYVARNLNNKIVMKFTYPIKTT